MTDVFRTDRHQTFRDGQLIAEDVVQVDVTEDAVAYDLAGKVRAALDVNAAFLAIASPSNAQTLAQVRALTRETSALIRLLARQVDGLGDLARDNAGT